MEGKAVRPLTMSARADPRVTTGVIIGYLEDGPNLVALAMYGWDEGHPAWWRNLERTRTPSFDWRASIRARCAYALPRERSVIGCGSAGSQSIPSSTPMPAGGRPRRP
jgi:hypothetical protein